MKERVTDTNTGIKTHTGIDTHTHTHENFSHTGPDGTNPKFDIHGGAA